MSFFSIGVSGDRVELVGGKMNVLPCLRCLSRAVLFMGKGGTWANLPSMLATSWLRLPTARWFHSLIR